MISKRYQYLFPKENNGFWNQVLNRIEQITEIRIRVNSPIVLYLNQKEISFFEGMQYIILYLMNIP